MPRIRPVLAGAVSIGAALGLIFPLLARLQDELGFSTAGLGLIAGSSFLAAVLAGALLAGLADRGHVRLLLVGGIALTAVALFWFAVGTELWQLVAARTLQGLGAGVYLPAARKVAVAGNPLRAGRVLGLLTSAEMGGFLLGPVVAAVLAEQVALWAPFVVVGTLTAVLALWLSAIRWPVPEVTAPRSPLAGVVMLGRPRVGGAALLSLAQYLPVGVYDAMWSRYLSDRGAGTLLIGVGLSLYSIPVIALAPRSGRVIDRIGAVRAATIAVIALVPLVVGYGLATGPLVITCIALVEGFPQSMALPAVQTAMVHACREEEVAQGQGLATSVNQIGAFLSALAAPIVYEHRGPVVLFTSVAVVMSVVFCLGLLLHRIGARAAPPESHRAAAEPT